MADKQMKKLSFRDILVILLIICSVVGAWFVLIALLLRLAIKGYAFYAWIVLLCLTILALKLKRKK
jgi:hypothetical protein